MRVYLKQKMAFNVVLMCAVMVLTFIGLLFTAITMDGWSNKHNTWPMIPIMIFIGGPMVAYLIFADKGYRISYDEEAVYHRPHGLTLKLGYPKEQIMRYEDIEVICGDMGAMINFGIMPFEFIRLIPKDWDGKQLFMISPFFLYHTEMKEMIWFLYEKRPDAFSKEVIDYLNSDKVL